MQNCGYEGWTLELERLWGLVSKVGPGTNALRVPRDDCNAWSLLLSSVSSVSSREPGDCPEQSTPFQRGWPRML